jgi:glycosyltransferase involved in cell wall biosynthesis
MGSDLSYHMQSAPLVSVLINNYNYARFLGAAVDSALSQDYSPIEVVVVDDGSTDSSRDIIAGYAGRIRPVLKKNGGQASAFNAGVAASRGEILCFLDADDVFCPEKVSHIIRAFSEHRLDDKPMMVHHLLSTKDESGRDLAEPPQGRTHASPLNLYAFARRHHYVPYEAGPTSTISINRALADRLFPIPEDGVRVSADDFIVYGSFLLGDVYSLPIALGGYRVHRNNLWYHSNRRKSLEFDRELERYLNAKLTENGLSPVIRFDDSCHIWGGLIDERRWAKLAWHVLKLCIRNHDRHIFYRAYRVAVFIGKPVILAIREKRKAFMKIFKPHSSVL